LLAALGRYQDTIKRITFAPALQNKKLIRR